MIEKAFLAFVGVVAVATAAATAVVAAAYALFEALRGPLGAAGAAGLVAAAIVLLFALAALAAAMGGRQMARKAADESPMGSVMKLAREKPIVAAGALVAAGIVAAVVTARNPRLVATAVSAFLAGRSNKKS